MISRNHLLASLLYLATAFMLGASATASGVTDTDGDGMPDVLETRLSTSPLPAMASDPDIADTDADGVPDLAEWVLTGQVSGAGLPAIVPEVRMFAMRAEGESFARVYLGVVGDPAEFDSWHVVRSRSGEGGSLELEAVDPYIIAETSVGAVPVLMLGTTLRIPEIDIPDGVGVGCVGEIGSDIVGATITLFVGDDEIPMVRIHDAVEVHDNPLSTPIQSVALPLDRVEYITGGPVGTDPPPAPEDAEVCGSADKREPTGTPGLLRSVVLATGCTSGEWSCPAGVCTMSGVGQGKVVIDVFALIGG